MLVGADLALAALALAELDAADRAAARAIYDRAARRHRHCHRRKLQRQSGLDGAPRSPLLGQAPVGRRGAASRCSATCWSSGRRAASCIAAWRRDLADASVDLVFAAGPLMARAVARLFPPATAAAMQRTRPRSKRRCCAAMRAGDAVMVKGSLGSRMGPIVKALRSKAATSAKRQSEDVERNALSLARSLSDMSTARQRVPLHHLPHRRRDGRRRCCSCSCSARPSSTRCGCCRARASRSAPTARNRTSSPRSRHADHGRADDPVRAAGRRPLLWANPPNPYVWVVLLRHARLRPASASTTII